MSLATSSQINSKQSRCQADRGLLLFGTSESYKTYLEPASSIKSKVIKSIWTTPQTRNREAKVLWCFSDLCARVKQERRLGGLKSVFQESRNVTKWGVCTLDRCIPSASSTLAHPILPVRARLPLRFCSNCHQGAERFHQKVFSKSYVDSEFPGFCFVTLFCFWEHCSNFPSHSYTWSSYSLRELTQHDNFHLEIALIL